MPDGPRPHGRRPRPVAGLPAVDAAAVAKAWLLELLAAAPLEAAAAVPVTLLAREAPALCEAVAAAVADDGALERLCTGDRAALAARAGALTGARGTADVVTGVDALRRVLHRALRTDTDAALAADTGDRLAHVCAQVAARALGAATAPAAGAPVVARPASVPAAEPTRLSAVPAPVVPPEAPGRPLTAQDLRPAAAPPSALEAALADPAAHPVTLLAIEVDDLERLLAIEGADELLAALAPVEEALAAAAGPQDVLVRERPGRWWLVAPGTGTEAARRLAGRLSEGFAADAPVRHGVPLGASIGVAVLPDDGHDAAALLEHAEQGVFTARALGVPVA